ncbi:unnamed protein product [Cochlearia groenlandica]
MEDFGIGSSVESKDVMLKYALPLKMKSLELHESNESDLQVLVAHNDMSLTTLENEALDPSPISIRCSDYTGGDVHPPVLYRYRRREKGSRKGNGLEEKNGSNGPTDPLGLVLKRYTYQMRATKVHSSHFFVVKK